MDFDLQAQLEEWETMIREKSGDFDFTVNASRLPFPSLNLRYSLHYAGEEREITLEQAFRLIEWGEQMRNAGSRS